MHKDTDTYTYTDTDTDMDTHTATGNAWGLHRLAAARKDFTPGPLPLGNGGAGTDAATGAADADVLGAGATTDFAGCAGFAGALASARVDATPASVAAPAPAAGFAPAANSSLAQSATVLFTSTPETATHDERLNAGS